MELNHQILNKIFGYLLPEADFQDCLKAAIKLTPEVGKLIEFKSGIYILLQGKVRLLNDANQLITTLEAIDSFGESTLFPQAHLEPYQVSASFNLQLVFIPDLAISKLLEKYHKIQEYFQKKANQLNALILEKNNKLLSSDKPLVKEFSEIVPETKKVKETASGEKNLGNCNRQSLGEKIRKNYLKISTKFVNSINPKKKTGKAGGAGNQPPNPITSKTIPKSGQKLYQAYFPSPSQKVKHWLQRTTRRYPFFAQQSGSDCGVACLVMIGRYYGKRLNINQLRDRCNVDRNGANLRSLSAAAETIGLSTRPVKASVSQLARQTLPAIAHWEGKHYVVVYEVARRQVVICDPAIGQRTLSLAQFQTGWTGYTLLLQPTASFKEKSETSPSLWQFISLIKPHWLVLLEVFAASIFIQIFSLVTPLFTQLILDRVVVTRSEITLTAMGLGLVLFGLFRSAMTGLRQYLLEHTANRLDVTLVVGFIKHTLRLPLGFFESHFVGDIMSRVEENNKIQRFLTGEALSVLLDLLTVFVYLSLMFWYNGKMALLVLGIVPPFFLLALVATPWLQRLSREIFNARTEEGSYLIQSLTGIATIKAMAVEPMVGWHWEELFGHSIKKVFSGQVIGNLLSTFSTTIETLFTAVLLWFGAWLAIHQELTIGQLVAFNMLLGNVITPFRRLTVLWQELQEVVISVERLQDVIDTEPEESGQVGQGIVLQGKVQFENVTFRYHPDSDRNILENVSFTIEPGQMVALVGRSGSGKTTISKLLLGLYPATAGTILIDGRDINTLSRRSLRQQVGVVNQDTFLFGGTIRENISLGCPGAELERVREAARLAGAQDFIEALPLGYETQIGEGGGLLSGGQRQRVAIARALLGNPRLLVFDEATSHLDAESERIIQDNLQTILQERTTFIIAHRLSTVRQADLILVLDRGVVVEGGTHEQLMAQRGHYFYLNQQQLAVA